MYTLTTHSIAARPVRELQIRQHVRPAISRGARTVVRAEDEKKAPGVVPGLNQWPPPAITETGEPAPEDDPKNYNVVTGERSDGLTEEEAKKKAADRVKDSPFSAGRDGGTQEGGGGEGSAS